MAKRKKDAQGSGLRARGQQAMPRAQSPQPLALQRLWAPWRNAYFTRTQPRGCFLCSAARSTSSLDFARDAARRSATATRAHRVVARGRWAFALPNLYPYNTGHMLIAPSRHVGTLEALTPQEWTDLLVLLRQLMKRLRATLHPQGFNIGLNLGKVAGAGFPGHLHLHLVPRWQGDTNFMPIVADTKVISQSLDALARLLTPSQRWSRR